MQTYSGTTDREVVDGGGGEKAERGGGRWMGSGEEADREVVDRGGVERKQRGEVVDGG